MHTDKLPLLSNNFIILLCTFKYTKPVQNDTATAKINVEIKVK